jgi:hypothetical protein
LHFIVFGFNGCNFASLNFRIVMPLLFLSSKQQSGAAVGKFVRTTASLETDMSLGTGASASGWSKPASMWTVGVNQTFKALPWYRIL